MTNFYPIDRWGEGTVEERKRIRCLVKTMYLREAKRLFGGLNRRLIVVLYPVIDLVHVVGKGFWMRLSFQYQLTLIDDEETERPRSIGEVKRVLHIVDQHGHFEIECLLELLSIVQPLGECDRLIDA